MPPHHKFRGAGEWVLPLLVRNDQLIRIAGGFYLGTKDVSRQRSILSHGWACNDVDVIRTDVALLSTDRNVMLNIRPPGGMFLRHGDR